MSDRPMPRLYLAGPDVFREDAARRGAELKALCERAGAVGVFPLDNDGLADGDQPAAIREACMATLRRCDAVVANMTPFRGPSMDPGTAYEMGAAAALGILVVGYTDDPRPYLDRVAAAMPLRREDDGTFRDLGGLSVEAFDPPLVDNLMMACGIAALFTTADDAIAFAASSLGR